MNRRLARSPPARTRWLAWGLLLSLGLPAVVGVAADVASLPERASPIPWDIDRSSVGNASGNGDPSGSNSHGLCPAAGPTILGIQWNCVAILNLTEVLLILAGIGIVAYVFRNSDRAELPGEAREVPVTVQEEEEYQTDRRLGLPYPTQEPPPEERE